MRAAAGGKRMALGGRDAYMLEQRALNFPIKIGSVGIARRLLAVAADLAQNDVLSAERRLLDLDRDLDLDSEPPPGLALRRGEERVSATLRARTLARILRDLATHGWTVLVEAGQVYVRAPSQHASATGLTEDEVRREKDRTRAQFAMRVHEQLHRPATRRFIAEQESLHFGSDGTRSVRSLIADGPTLAATLQSRGAAAIQPYLQVADDRVDEHSGLKLWDVYRYFRYFWSFPFYSTPGRTLPLLLRDAGQPSHPVCGLICLASPVPKLGARDAALGLTPAWLEAITLGLECAAAQEYRSRLHDLWADVEAIQDESLTPHAVSRDLCRLLRLESDGSVDGLAAALGRLSAAGRRARVAGARARVVADLLAEVQGAVREIAVSDLGFTHAGLLKNPTRYLEALRKEGASTHAAWRRSRSLDRPPDPARPRRVRKDSVAMSAGELRRYSRDPLFLKKRVAQLRALLEAWAALGPLRERASAEQLHALVFGDRRASSRLSGGDHVVSGLRNALVQRLSRLVAAQIADVSVCGAVPPYGPLLGGKLAALVALSGEVADLYFQQYDGQVSDIKSKMAGRAYTRPAELIALTTTSFFSIGSSQYNRVRLPDTMGGVGWSYVGQSAGHGSMHFSLDTTEFIQRMLKVETGEALITSEFGEGPSERMRKVRDGLTRLGLPAAELLRHGQPRRVYVAELSPGESRPGAPGRAAPWCRCGPRASEVAEFWRTRWLEPRLRRVPTIIRDLAAFDRSAVLLSRRLEDTSGGLVLVSGGAE